MEALQALECPVCLNTLDQNHKVLGCQHTFCTNCLEILYDEQMGHVRCPECRHLNFITSIAHLPNNIVLMRLLQSMDDQAKKEEEKASSSDDEPVVMRKKVAKPKRKFRKIRSQLSESDDEPVIKDSDSDEEKKPVIKDSDSEEEEEKKPVIESESENEDTKCDENTSKQSKSGSSSSSSSSGSDSSDSSDSEDSSKNDSGSATDTYFSDSEQKKIEAFKRLEEEERKREEERRKIWEIFDPLTSTPKEKKEAIGPEEKNNKESRKRSGRLAEKYQKVFQMPNRKSVLDSIPSTSSPEKACMEAKKFRPRRRINNFTKVNSSYNNDPDYTDESDAAEFINENPSPSECSDESYYSDDSTKRHKKKQKPAKKRKRQRRQASVSDSEDEHTEDYSDYTAPKLDASDEYLPPAKKKPSRIKRAPQISDDEEGHWCSSDDDNSYQRREPISKRQKKRLRESIESGSRFEQLKRQREEEKKGKL